MLIDLGFLDGWDEELDSMNAVKRDGRRFQYPNSYIEFLAFLKTGFQIPYRTVEGVVRGLSNYVKGLKEMHFTQIRRRMLRLNPTVGFDYDSDADEPVTLIVDSTGLSTTKKGAYIEQMWVKKKRKFIKLHIGIDEKTKKIVEFDVTTPRVADTKRFKKIVKGAARKVGEENIVKVYGDKAHDSRENFNLLDSMNIEPGIAVKRNATERSRGCQMRKQEVQMIRKIGYKGWSRLREFGRRWIVEIVISALKRVLGDTLYGRKFASQKVEARLKVALYNRFLSL